MALRTSRKYALQRLLFGDCGPQRMVGIDFRSPPSTQVPYWPGKRHHVIADGLTAGQSPSLRISNEYGGDFEQRVGLRVETPGFYIDYHGQEAAESASRR